MSKTAAVRTIVPEPPRLAGRVCPDCNLRRTTLEFQAGPETLLNCRNCWTRHGRKRRLGRPPKEEQA